MKRYLIPIILFSSMIHITASDGAIGLKNIATDKTSTVKNSKGEREDVTSEKDRILSQPIMPKSVYIGELSDFKSSNINQGTLLKDIVSFLDQIKDKRSTNSYIISDYDFIFSTVYQDSLMGEDDLIHWNIGHVDMFSNSASVAVELHYRSTLYIGRLYLSKEDRWMVTDLQLEEEEKKVFDPSSPY